MVRNFWYTIKQTPQRLKDALTDPIRRKHLVVRTALEAFTGVTGVAWYIWMPHPWCYLLAGPVAAGASLIMYEFILEPILKNTEWIWPYWEGGPRDGQTFRNP